MDNLDSSPAGKGARMMSLCLLFVALFLCFSRISFDPFDISHFSQPPQSPARNLGGAIGAQIVYGILLVFGEAFWWLPALLVIWSFRLSKGERLHWRQQIWVVLLGLPCTAMILCFFMFDVPPWAPSVGGLFGLIYFEACEEQIGIGGFWLLQAVGFGLMLYLFDLRGFFRSCAQVSLPKPTFGEVTKKESEAGLQGSVYSTPQQPAFMPDVRPRPKKESPAAEMPPIAEVVNSVLDMPEEPPAFQGPMIPAVPKVQLKSRPAVDGEYECPDLDLLQPPIVSATDSDEFLEQRARHLEDMFEKFKVTCKVIGMVKGPSITQYEMTIDAGTRVNKVTTLADNIALTLRATSVRIVAPIPGRNSIGIEVPNHKKEMVNLRSILDMPECQARREQMMLPLVLGKDVVGDPLVEDLSKMPHLLVAGTTGSGKSVCINSIIISLILYNKPEQVRLLMIDPKMVEMSGYEGIPHLMRPVITNMDEAAGVLDWACRTMDERYAMLTRVKVRDIASYNRLKRPKMLELVGSEEALDKMEYPMPYIVIIVDEFSDLMMVGAKEIESYITRLAQKSRAVGIHVILATQRPSVDVITGLIKTNMPSRVAFQVASKIDSRTILDQNGADKLMGRGDMLFMPPGGSALVRAQGVMVGDDEISNVVEFWKAQGEPEYIETSELSSATAGGNADMGAPAGENEDKSDDYVKAVELIVETGRPSASFIQRQLRVGYNKASRFIELMETMGVVGPPRGSKGREVLWTPAEIESWKSTL